MEMDPDSRKAPPGGPIFRAFMRWFATQDLRL
ncbi:hypothetical protein MMB232_00650 [Brevundimonas subvibrioides]|uniref:Uncharacterized protein n=1 Tax=Brevundimonas subvibrioides (strain ATCC 15264 / DSM 4735 / LMG 14903 / NBRC 16000 / CB 81) TaxID=633149 RepID=D9QLS4_BRESC|nr:hypothetical protein Bresu_0693 [Brevundimonas subvibrioides ATCC 15264]